MTPVTSLANASPGYRLHALEKQLMTVDPGQLLNERAHVLVTTGNALDRDDAIRIAQHELPDVAAAYAAGELMSVSKVAAPQMVEPIRTHVDAGMELMRLVGLAMAAEHVNVDQATKLVLKRDPTLAAAYAAATPLPMGRPTQPAGCIDDLVADGLASYAKLQADLADIQHMAELAR